MAIRKCFRGERLLLCVGVVTSAIVMQVRTAALDLATPMTSGAACAVPLWRAQQSYGVRWAACWRADGSTDAKTRSRANAMPRATPRQRLWV
jgi:hypothetical protein